jgi:hypothetical protein
LPLPSAHRNLTLSFGVLGLRAVEAADVPIHLSQSCLFSPAIWSCIAAGHGIRSEQTVEERRKFPRTEIEEAAYVSSGGSVMSCVVRNISVEGAAIDVENPAFVPARFRLVMAKDNSVHECAIAWIRQKRIGLTFIVPPDKNGS